MGITAVIKERNGAGAGAENTVTGDVLHGDTDNYTFVPADHPISPNSNAYEKYVRLYVTDLDGLTSIDNLKVWISAGSLGAETAMKTNARGAGYLNKTYVQPVKAASTQATEDMPTSEPVENLGISGALGNSITSVPSYSDYLVMQIQITVDETDGKEISITLQWDENP